MGKILLYLVIGMLTVFIIFCILVSVWNVLGWIGRLLPFSKEVEFLMGFIVVIGSITGWRMYNNDKERGQLLGD